MRNREIRIGVCNIAVAVVFCVATSTLHAAEDQVASFRAKTQALFDALVTGDKAVWDRTLDDDCIITTEDGKFLSKAQMLADVRPLPPGFAAQIRVRDLTVRRVGNAAVVHYWLDEVETIFGQELRTTYVQTDTYQRTGHVWKAVAQQETVVPRDLQAIAVDSKDWKLLLGDYSLSDKATSRYRVFERNGTLYGGKDEATASRLIPLAPLVFFQQGSIHVMVFVKDPGGAINEVRELHKYNEVRMRRVEHF
jgi:hypothetical protein